MAIAVLVVVASSAALIWMFRPAPFLYVLSRLGFSAPMVIGRSEIVMTKGWFTHWSSEGKYSSDMLGPQFSPKPSITVTKVDLRNLQQTNQIIFTDLTTQCRRGTETKEVLMETFTWGRVMTHDPGKAVAFVPEHCLGVASSTGDHSRLKEALSEIIAIRQKK